MDDAIGIVRDARRLVVLSGAGVSTESGIPDFRSPGGIWSRFDPDDFAYERLLADPLRFWTLRARLMQEIGLDRARPNAAHEAIARASRSERLLGHVTQNIDGLFQRAGHAEAKLIEAHGSAARVRCLACARFAPFEERLLATLPPRCEACGGTLKPGTILFGEALHAPDLDRAIGWARACDAMVVAGSSLRVHPIAQLPALALERGAHLVIVDRGSTPYDEQADVVVRERASVAMPRLLREMELTAG